MTPSTFLSMPLGECQGIQAISAAVSCRSCFQGCTCQTSCVRLVNCQRGGTEGIMDLQGQVISVTSLDSNFQHIQSRHIDIMYYDAFTCVFPQSFRSESKIRRSTTGLCALMFAGWPEFASIAASQNRRCYVVRSCSPFPEINFCWATMHLFHASCVTMREPETL